VYGAVAASDSTSQNLLTAALHMTSTMQRRCASQCVASTMQLNAINVEQFKAVYQQVPSLRAQVCSVSLLARTEVS
jgi:hypothetical protein